MINLKNILPLFLAMIFSYPCFAELPQEEIGKKSLQQKYVHKRKSKVINNKKKKRVFIKIENNYPVGFNDCGPFTEGLAAVYINGKWGWINKFGEFIIRPKYDHGYMFENGVVHTDINGKWGYIDKKGEIIIPFKYDEEKGLEEVSKIE